MRLAGVRTKTAILLEHLLCHMCGRSSLFQPQPEIERRFSAEFTFDYEPRSNIAPERSDIAAEKLAGVYDEE